MSNISRRSFLKGTSAGGAVTLLSSSAGVAVLSRKSFGSSWMAPDTTVETPDAHQIATVKAMADTFIPNWDGAPGAIETDAFTTINDPWYGLNPYISEVVSDLDDWCWWTYWWNDFLGLSTSDRNYAMEERMGYHGSTIESWYKDAYEGMLALTKLNFFGGLVNPIGTNYIGFPGLSAGYSATSAAGAYQSGDTPQNIPDNNTTGINSYISVTGSGTVSELKVTVWITHTYQGDLIVTLYSPSGASYILHNGSGGSADNVIQIAVNVTAFNGATAAGSWRLHVRDRYAADTGTLKFWSFKLRTNLDG